MGLSLLALQLGSFQDSTNMVDGAQVHLLAESALQEARYYITYVDTNFTGTGPEQTVTIGNTVVGTFRYVVTKSGNIYDITATGYVPSSTAKKKTSESITWRIRNPNPLVLFSDNFEANNLNAWTQVNDSGTSWIVSTTAPNKGTYHGRGQRTASGGGTRIARLLTPILNLSYYDTVVLKFNYRMLTGNEVRFRVHMNSTGSPTTGWVQILSDSSNAWTSTYNRPATRLTITPLTSTMQFRFEAHLSQAGQAWFLDDVQLMTPYSFYDKSVDNY